MVGRESNVDFGTNTQDRIQQISLKRQQQVVKKILNNLEQERLTVGYSWDLLQRSIEYAYSIGVGDGKKLIGHGKPVGQFKDGRLINRFLSASEASRSVRLTKTAVMKCLAGKTRKCSGYEWKYITD